MAWHQTSASSRGYGAAWRRLRALVLSQEPLCRPCAAAGRVTAATEVDHLKPKAKGGADDLENLMPICRPCHHDKTIRDNGGRVRVSIALDGWPVE